MSIHFISGKPGGGKSLYGVRLIVDELIKGDRVIVTNVPLKLGEVNAYLQKNHPDVFARWYEAKPDVLDGLSPNSREFCLPTISDRIIVIDEDELPKFFTFRGEGVRLDSVNNQQWKQGVRPDFSKVKDKGVFYVLDEVHIAFNSRAWADTGNEVLYYLSQHRKLGDDVICITQAIANVDKQFRSVAQDFTYLRNLAKQRAGFFRLPGVFIRNTYTQPATDNSKPTETGTFTLDVAGMASLYDTAKGVGIHGRAGADTKSRKKGLHWMWFVVVAPVVIICTVHFLPKWVAWVMTPAGLRHSVPASHAPAASPLPEQAVPFVPAVPQGAVDPRSLSGGSPAAAEPVFFGTAHGDTNAVVCTGYTVLFGQATVFFSDGSTAFSADGDVQEVRPHWVTCFGRRFRVIAGRSVAIVSESFAGDIRRSDQIPVSESPVPVSDSPPVNQVMILPSISGQASGMVPPQRLNGFAGMGSSSIGGRAMQ